MSPNSKVGRSRLSLSHPVNAFFAPKRLQSTTVDRLKNTIGASLKSLVPYSMFVNIRTLFIIFGTLVSLEARFNLDTCWSRDCIKQNGEGTWCYFPPPGETRATVCGSGGADFTTVLGVHKRQGLSIAYYNGVDNTLLGGADWPLPANPGVVRLCVSGATGAGTYQTLCVNAVADNTLSNSPYCQVAVGQDNVTDGCYIHSTTTSKATATQTSNALVLFFSTLLASLHSLYII